MPANVDDTLYRALIQMGLSPQEAQYRLHDILVEEVSVVDRAANKRRFLMVKSAGAKMDNDTTTTDPKKLTLAKGTKETLLGVLEKGLRDLVEVTTLVKNASDDGADEAVPTEIAGGLLVAAETIRGSFAKYLPKPQGLSEQALALRGLSDVAYDLSKSEKVDGKLVAGLAKSTLAFVASLAKNQVLAQALQEIAEVSMVLAQMASEMEEGAELPEDMRATMEQLAVKLTELVGSTGGGEGSEGGEKTVEDAAKAAAAAAAAGKDLDDEGVTKAVMDVSTALSAIGKAGAKMSASRRKQLRGAMETMQAGFKSLMDLLSEVEPTDTNKSANGGNTADMDAAMTRIASLEAQIKKLAERPNAPASLPEGSGGGSPPPAKKPATSGQGGPWIL